MGQRNQTSFLRTKQRACSSFPLVFVKGGVGKGSDASGHRSQDQFKKSKLEFHLTRGVQRWNKLRRKDKRLVQAAPVWMLRAAILCNEVASCGMFGLLILSVGNDGARLRALRSEKQSDCVED
jgi:hypothetical protein